MRARVRRVAVAGDRYMRVGIDSHGLYKLWGVERPSSGVRELVALLACHQLRVYAGANYTTLAITMPRPPSYFGQTGRSQQACVDLRQQQQVRSAWCTADECNIIAMVIILSPI